MEPGPNPHSEFMRGKTPAMNLLQNHFTHLSNGNNHAIVAQVSIGNGIVESKLSKPAWSI